MTGAKMIFMNTEMLNARSRLMAGPGSLRSAKKVAATPCEKMPKAIQMNTPSTPQTSALGSSPNAGGRYLPVRRRATSISPKVASTANLRKLSAAGKSA